jgi:uncharacterized protein (UPF0276 family)
LALAISEFYQQPSSLAQKLVDLAQILEIKTIPEPTWLPQGKPRIFHANFGLTQKGFTQYFDSLNTYLRQHKISLFSCDLGPAAATYKNYRPTSPILGPQELETLISQMVKYMRSNYQGPIAVENYNFFPTGLYEHICEPSFIAKMMHTHRLNFVLDLAHAAVTSHNLNLDLLHYLQMLPLELVVEIHLSKPYLPPKKANYTQNNYNPAKNLFVTDLDNYNLAQDHHYCPAEKEIELLIEVLKMLPPEAPRPLVVVEYYKNYSYLYDVLLELKQFCL